MYAGVLHVYAEVLHVYAGVLHVYAGVLHVYAGVLRLYVGALRVRVGSLPVYAEVCACTWRFFARVRGGFCTCGVRRLCRGTAAPLSKRVDSLPAYADTARASSTISKVWRGQVMLGPRASRPPRGGVDFNSRCCVCRKSVRAGRPRSITECSQVHLSLFSSRRRKIFIVT